VFSVAFLHPGRKLGPKVCGNKKMRKKWHLFPWLMEGFKKDEITEQRKIKPNHSLGWFKGIAGLEICGLEVFNLRR
jgi:hypothetical protein